MELQTFDPEGDLILILIQQSEEEDTRPEGDTDDTLGSSDEISPILTDDFASSNTLVQYPTCNPKSEPEKEIRMLVSSRHLMLASPVFKAMLQHSNFKEGQELHVNGKVEIPLPDDDPEAFKILLDIIQYVEFLCSYAPHHNHKCMSDSSTRIFCWKVMMLI
jgi:hypothetical protein